MESLPENVIDEILRLLPTKTAARTAVLSRSWLHRWRSIPDLDVTPLPSPIISGILHLHSGPIRLFKARSDGDDAASLRWLSSLSHRASSTLRSLDLSDFAPSLRLHSIAVDFPILAHLRLYFCSLLPDLNPSPHFRFLQTLHLHNVRLSVSGRLRLSSLIPSCPSLESLTLTNFEGDLCCDLFACEFPRLAHLKLSYCDLEFEPSDSSVQLAALQTLHLDSADFYGQIADVFSACPGMERLTMMYVGLVGGQWIDIEAFNLRWIKFVEIMNLRGFVITSAPVLEMVVLDCRVCGYGGDGGGDSGDCNLMKLLRGSDYIKKLKLGTGIFEFMRNGNIPKRLPMSFHHLRSMTLDVDFGDVKDLLVVLCLLRSAPNLQELKLKGSFYNREVLGDGRDFWEAQEDINLFDNLETLKIIEIMGVEAELDFIEFVLAKAKVLHKLMISFNGYIRDKQLVMEKLLELSMDSNQVQVIINDDLMYF